METCRYSEKVCRIGIPKSEKELGKFSIIEKHVIMVIRKI
jgi:hypothetical protein